MKVVCHHLDRGLAAGTCRGVASAVLLLAACGEPRPPSDDPAAHPMAQDDGDPVTGTGGETPSDDTTSAGVGEDADGSGSSGATFDVGAPTGPDPECPEDPPLEFSYIWIANSDAGTVSKLDTVTGVELARYVTGPENRRDPSRTSVNLRGDVAVVNRQGSISKIAARVEDCVDRNDNGEIETSASPNDVLPWGEDECVLWTTLLDNAARPVAWTAGAGVGPDGCGGVVQGNPDVWTAAPEDAESSRVLLLDGNTGEVQGEALVSPGNHTGYGIYGAAVDGAGDFWGVVYGVGPLVHVSRDDLMVETFPLPNPSAYGFTVDAEGRPWIGGWDGAVQSYDPTTAEWTTVNVPEAWRGLNRGMTQDADGRLWIAMLNPGGTKGLLRVDTDTAMVSNLLSDSVLPGVETPTGTSVDAQGRVWLVDETKGGGGAFVYDPAGGAVQWIGGLDHPYTYSDMTGWALANVTDLPEG